MRFFVLHQSISPPVVWSKSEFDWGANEIHRGIESKFITRDFSDSESGVAEFQARPGEREKDIPGLLSDV